MTYQRNIERLGLEVEEDVFDKTGESEVCDPEVCAYDSDRENDGHGRGEELTAVWPLDLLELADRLADEAAEAAAPLFAGAGLALRLADGLDLAPALAGALSRGGLLESGALPAGALGSCHQRSPPEQIALTDGETRASRGRRERS
jgi:hypothetical protein